jgi:hypothetical protein
MEGRKIILSISEYFKDKEESLWKDYEAAHVPRKLTKAEKGEVTSKGEEGDKADKKAKEDVPKEEKEVKEEPAGE